MEATSLVGWTVTIHQLQMKSLKEEFASVDGPIASMETVKFVCEIAVVTMCTSSRLLMNLAMYTARHRSAILDVIPEYGCLE